MKLIRQQRSWGFALLITVLFLCARAGSFAHAAQYGTAPHNHNNKICVFSVLANDDQQDLAMPPANITIPLATECAFGYAPAPFAVIWTSQSVQATARAPPGQ